MAALLVATLQFSCSGGGKSADYGEPLYTPRHAGSFEIYATGGQSTILRSLNPWQGAHDVAKDLFIARDGEVPPEGFEGEVVKAGPGSVICMSTSHIAFIDSFGCAGAVRGVSGKNYVSTPVVAENIAQGKVVDVGYDANLNYELIASVKPDIVFIFGVAGENTAVTDKLKEMGITAFYVGDYLEHTPLGKAEWVVALGEIFDRRNEASKVFDGIESSYTALKEQARQYTAHPRVMLNAPYRDTWFVPGDESYVVTLIADAGGEYVCSGHSDDISRPLSGEAAYIYLTRSDIWLNPNQAESIADLTAENPKFADVDVVKNRGVYNSTRRTTPAGGSDFWESGALRADIVLADILQILHPESAPGRELYYFKLLE